MNNIEVTISSTVQTKPTEYKINQKELQCDIDRLNSKGLPFYNKTCTDYSNSDRQSETEQA